MDGSNDVVFTTEMARVHPPRLNRLGCRAPGPRYSSPLLLAGVQNRVLVECVPALSRPRSVPASQLRAPFGIIPPPSGNVRHHFHTRCQGFPPSKFLLYPPQSLRIRSRLLRVENRILPAQSGGQI